MTQGLFILDLDRCTGCSACVVACKNENPASTAWRTVHTFNQQRLPLKPVFHYSLACNHCLDPACLAHCPANAYTKDLVTGAVILNSERCMGCRYCSWVCPYDSPRFNAQLGVMEKCTFCDHRLDEGLDPACVTACPVDALRFDPNAEIEPVGRPGFPETGLGPSVQIVGFRQDRAPHMTATPSFDGRPVYLEDLTWKGLRSEWSLWLFTTVASLLVAWFTAATTLGGSVFFPVFAVAGIIGMAVSSLHLGKISRIFRAFFNFRRSWISREIVFFSAFFGAACTLSLFQTIPQSATYFIVVLGFAALFSMDMVYRVPGMAVAAVPHSAMTTLSTVLFVGVILGEPALVWPVAGLKLALYLMRRPRPLFGRKTFTTARIMCGLLIPSVAAVPGSVIPMGVALAAAIVGELVDRAEFYALLRFLTPSLQIERDLDL